MSLCVECCEEVDALADDYLCQEHRDLLDGIRYCKECKKRFAPKRQLDLLCSSCAEKDPCEYCGKLYSEKYLLSRATRKGTDGKPLTHGVKFKGLCNACKQIALESIPHSLPNHVEVQCPDCNYHWDLDLEHPNKPVYIDR